MTQSRCIAADALCIISQGRGREDIELIGVVPVRASILLGLIVFGGAGSTFGMVLAWRGLERTPGCGTCD